MENRTSDEADRLMFSGAVGLCHDCGDERLLIAVDATEFCCTTCDGAVFVLDGVGAAALVTRRAS